MNVEDVKALARLMADTGLTRLEFETTDGDHLNLERGIALDPASVIGMIGGNEATPAAAISQPEALPAAETPVQKEGTVVNSPMVGVFYAALSPDSDPFVQVGDTVKKGDVLCIIEAMKLMNEIQSEVDGTIVEICVDNGQVVEYDQPLMRIV